jgi:predicted nucleic acid-binding protein
MLYVPLAERLGRDLVTADRRLVERVTLLPFVRALPA